MGTASAGGEDTPQQPRLGWAALSRARLNKAEAQLEQGKEGVRDEVGVLALHTAYADRFFPGTSTQQRRLRYALFVPWQIESLLRGRTSAVQARGELERREIQLANRLRGEEFGVIGVQNAADGRPVSIPPSSAYWVAFREWGVVNPLPHGVAPTRHDVFRHWDKWGEGRPRRQSMDDEGRELTVFPRLFVNGLPKAPRYFAGRGPLDFELEDGERRFMRARLMETTRSFDGRPSLLAALVSAGIVPTEREQLWSRRIAGQADEWDRKAIERARGAASLSAVARALYAAAVEALLERDGVAAAQDRHRHHLVSVIAEHGARAVSLQLECLASDGIYLDGRLLGVLRHVQQWVATDGKNPLERTAYRVLVDWECGRKGSRSKLPRSSKGREARRGWGNPGRAEPIGYRWWVVRSLLQDLAGSGHGV